MESCLCPNETNYALPSKVPKGGNAFYMSLDSHTKNEPYFLLFNRISPLELQINDVIDFLTLGFTRSYTPDAVQGYVYLVDSFSLFL